MRAAYQRTTIISFLPFTHIFERGWSYLAISMAARIIINTEITHDATAVDARDTTCMSSVPALRRKYIKAVRI